MSLRATLVLLLLGPSAAAQQAGPRVTVGQLDLETYRYAVSAERRSIMEANIALEPGPRARFFAIFDEYEKERLPLDSERFALLQRYAAAQSSLSEPQAMALVRAVAALQIREIQLRSRFTERFEKQLGGLVGARFHQVDDVVTTAHRLNSLQGVPLAGAPLAAR